MLDVDALAAEIRRVDGSNSLGAGALAEALMPFIKAQQNEMVRAIQPFADIAMVCDDEYADVIDFSDDDRVNVVQAHGCLIETLSIEDFRAARSAWERATQ